MTPKPKLLIFEDDLPLARSWTRHLRDSFEVVVASAMTEVSALVREHEFAAVVVDLFIVHEDGRADNEGGVTLISSMREGLSSYPTWCRNVPIVAITGARPFNGFDPLLIASNVGADRVLRKPVAVDELRDEIEKLIDHPRSRR